MSLCIREGAQNAKGPKERKGPKGHTIEVNDMLSWGLILSAVLVSAGPFPAFTLKVTDKERIETVQKWVREHDLARRPGENDIDFARRVFVTIKRNLAYEFKTGMDRRASAVCRAGTTDCGGLSVLFVTILRGNDIPARTLVGRWAQSSKAKDIVGDSPYYQTHVKAEFF